MAECKTTGDVQARLKRLFAGTIEQMLEAEMDKHLGYEKNSVASRTFSLLVMITSRGSVRTAPCNKRDFPENKKSALHSPSNPQQLQVCAV